MLCLPRAGKKSEIGSDPFEAAPGQLYQNDKTFQVSAAPAGRLRVGLPEALRGEGVSAPLLPVHPSGIACVAADSTFIKINLVLLGKDINKLSSNEKCERNHTPPSGS